MAVVATAGTTVLGAFDPVFALAPIAKRHGAWLHVDGALGSSLLLHPEHRDLIRGSELADSLAWNPHKMMGLTLTCSAILVRRPGLLHEAFNEHADYLFQSDDDELNLGTKSIQCGRRNDALKLWAAWKVHGDAGWAKRIDRQLGLARHAADKIDADPDLILTKRPHSINVCFEVAGKSSAEICERLNREGLAQVGHAVVEGRRVIRLVTANPDLLEEDIERFFADLKRLAADLSPGENAVPAADAVQCA
jgi:glutamate/tyrosine decarboxylase-like PLP-dependent enzyme